MNRASANNYQPKKRNSVKKTGEKIARVKTLKQAVIRNKTPKRKRL